MTDAPAGFSATTERVGGSSPLTCRLNSSVLRRLATPAGIGAGVWKDLNEVRTTWQAERVFSPEMEQSLRTSLVEEFTLSVERAKLRLRN